MLPRPRGIPISEISRAIWLAGILLLLSPVAVHTQQIRNHVVLRDDLSPAHREQLTVKLRSISGFADLKFDADGILHQGNRAPTGGSVSARELIGSAISGRNVVVIEDASNHSEVAFCRVIPGRWKKNAAGNPPVFVVQIDFADFDQVVGDQRALEAFNVGWGLLHELDHIVNDSADATSHGETGECEDHINQMRLECNLPLRTGYFFTLLPPGTDSAFMTRFVRLAFEQEQPQTKKKKRYWVIWDTNVVGGLETSQIAALR
jgi:hypothetical protein